jgi:hypothetical protein
MNGLIDLWEIIMYDLIDLSGTRVDASQVELLREAGVRVVV